MAGLQRQCGSRRQTSRQTDTMRAVQGAGADCAACLCPRNADSGRNCMAYSAGWARFGSFQASVGRLATDYARGFRRIGCTWKDRRGTQSRATDCSSTRVWASRALWRARLRNRPILAVISLDEATASPGRFLLGGRCWLSSAPGVRRMWRSGAQVVSHDCCQPGRTLSLCAAERFSGSWRCQDHCMGQIWKAHGSPLEQGKVLSQTVGGPVARNRQPAPCRPWAYATTRLGRATKRLQLAAEPTTTLSHAR